MYSRHIVLLIQTINIGFKDRLNKAVKECSEVITEAVEIYKGNNGAVLIAIHLVLK
jgi:hypothetical protein